MSPIIEVLKETIKRLILKHDYKTLEKLLSKTHKGDIAEVLKYLSKEERFYIVNTLVKTNTDKASEVFTDLEEDIKAEILRNLNSKDLLPLLVNLTSSEIIKILDLMPEDTKSFILKNLQEDKLQEINMIVSKEEDSIATVVSKDYIALFENTTVSEALEIIRQSLEDIEVLYIYVVDDKNRLVGIVSFKDILNNAANINLKDIMNRDLIFVNINQTKEEVIDIFKRYDLYMLPVVDDDDVLQGVVYVQNILDVISEKTTEDFFKMAGAQEEELFYQDKTFKIAKLRLPWLLAATFGEFITAIIISFFRYTIEQFLPIIFFLPMVAALSGNISSQAAIITARGLKEGRLSENIYDYIQSVIKELKVSLVLGLIIGIFVGFVSSLWISNHKLGMIVGIALFFSMFIAGLLGSLVPYLMDRFGKDPTLATGPIVLTLNDIVGISIYLIVAAYFIHYLNL